MILNIYTDGGSRGNPGEAGVGVYIKNNTGEDIEKRYKYLGIMTNNEAEYNGAYLGIKRGIALGAKDINLYMDSRLVISQLSGKWKVKNDNLKIIYNDIINILKKNNININYFWIKREKNKEADRLSNVAMNKKI